MAKWVCGSGVTKVSQVGPVIGEEFMPTRPFLASLALVLVLVQVGATSATPEGSNGDAPVEVAKLTAVDPNAHARFGSSVAVDGATMVIGAPSDPGDDGQPAGSARVFVRHDGTWVEEAKLTASDATGYEALGSFVAVDGDTIVVGAPYADGAGRSRAGAVYVFVRQGDGWVEQAKLTASDADVDDAFGFSVDVDGDTVIVGAHRNDDAGTWSGAAYIFVREDGQWAQEAKLRASDEQANQYFGKAVALSGQTAVIGADGDGSSGAAYVFSTQDDTWTQQVKLTASDADRGDNFGSSVAIDDGTFVVGATSDDHAVDQAGSAYVFVQHDDVYEEVVKLTAVDAMSGHFFGSTTAVSDDMIIVGALGDDGAGSRSGAAYVYQLQDGSWGKHAKLTASDADTGDYFGATVAVDGDNVLIGAARDNDTFTSSGSAYVFDLTPNAAPDASDDNYGLTDLSVSVDPIGLSAAAPGVLSNDTDRDGDPITARLVTPPQNGTIRLQDDGAFVYAPAMGFTGTDEFTYVADDGDLASEPAAVTIHVAGAP